MKQIKYCLIQIPVESLIWEDMIHLILLEEWASEEVEWISTHHNYSACSLAEEAEAWAAWKTCSEEYLEEEAAVEEVHHVVVLNSLEDFQEVSVSPLEDQEDLVVSQDPLVEEEAVAATLLLVSVCE